ncbi:MAG: ABC transporter permease [Clostridia bacterium]|nr:ABC transporter permease [Clostridia bacterium]
MKKKNGKDNRYRSYYQLSWDILRKNHLAMFCLFVILVLVFIAVFAPYLTPYEPNVNKARDRFQSPNPEHPFGTDQFGRDILTRVFYGCRISLSVGIISQLIACFLGYFIGVCAGYFGGKTDTVLSFIIQVFSSFPFLLFAIAVMFILGPGLVNLYIALGLLGWTSTARLIRGEVMRLKNSEYIQACIVCGGSPLRVILKHLLPNCVPILIITVTLGIPNAILSEASLSFLGLGVSPPTASWGSMISEAQPFIRGYTYYSLFPGLAIIITVLSFNLLGDGLRDALDPKLRS